jgi:hypothetical protein
MMLGLKAFTFTTIPVLMLLASCTQTVRSGQPVSGNSETVTLVTTDA